MNTTKPTKHHPSCKPGDRDLVWLCNQCGAHESAEDPLPATPAQAHSPLSYAPKGVGRSHETKSQIADERDSLCVKLGEAKRERDKAQAHAQRLADALKQWLDGSGTDPVAASREALAQWEGDKQ